MTVNIVKFEQVISEAKAKAASSPAWIRAIERAAEMILDNAYMDYSDGELLILSDSGNIYRANGICQCAAFKRNRPCKHRALARLVQRYVEAESKPQPKSSTEGVLIKPQPKECRVDGWMV
jgi:hypothetical protein